MKEPLFSMALAPLAIGLVLIFRVIMAKEMEQEHRKKFLFAFAACMFVASTLMLISQFA